MPRASSHGRWSRLACLAVTLVGGGCYDSHGQPGAGPFDASALSPRPDAGAPARLDAGGPWLRRDAGAPLDGVATPLPPEPEPDPLPDEPPTGPWDDVPPPTDPAMPGLERVGERVQLDDASDTGGPPVVVWNGEGWGVAWGNGWGTWRLRFMVLDEAGRPTGAEARTMGRVATAGGGIGLDFAIGRYALISPGSTAAVVDRAATLVAGWSAIPAEDNADVARLAVDHRWLVATTSGGGDPASDVRAYELDDDMAMVPGPPIELARDGAGDVRVATAKTRALVAWTTSAGVMGRVLRGAPLEPIGEPLMLHTLPQLPDSAVAVEPFRNRFVVAAVGASGVRAQLVEAFASEPLASAPIAVGTAGVRDRRPGIASASELGFFVVCWASGPGPAGGSRPSDDGVTLQVVGADGSLWGAPLSLVTGEPNIGGVDCGWNGEEVVVIWWRASGDGAFNTMFSERARPTFR